MLDVAAPIRKEPKNLREVGKLAVWSLSSAKPGNGVEQLRDDNTDTYWQSDGAQPHLINLQFHKKMKLSEIRLYLDYKLDESYTPKRLSIRSGSTFHDLVEIDTMECDEAQGWVTIPLRHVEPQGATMPLKTSFLQIAVVTMHQNGRDTHVRQIKVYSPRHASSAFLMTGIQVPQTVDMASFSCIR